MTIFARTNAVPAALSASLCLLFATPASAQRDPAPPPSRDQNTNTQDSGTQVIQGIFNTLRDAKRRKDAEDRRRAAEWQSETEDGSGAEPDSGIGQARTLPRRPVDRSVVDPETRRRPAVDPAPQTHTEPPAVQPDPTPVAQTPRIDITPTAKPPAPEEQPLATATPATPSASVPVASPSFVPATSGPPIPAPPQPPPPAETPSRLWLWILLAAVLLAVATVAARRFFFAVPPLLPAARARPDTGTTSEPEFAVPTPALALMITPRAFTTTTDYPE